MIMKDAHTTLTSQFLGKIGKRPDNRNIYISEPARRKDYDKRKEAK